MYNVSLENRDSLTSFSISIHLNSFFYCLAAARASNAISKGSRDRGRPCFIPDFDRIKFFSIKDNVGYELIIYSLYYVKVYSLQSHSLSDFNVKACRGLSKAFSASIEMIM